MGGYPQDRKCVVGLDGVTRQMRDARERLFEAANTLTEAVEVVRVERRADLLGDGGQLGQ